MYSVLDYGRMAADPVRMDAYARALTRAVRPGSVVVDLGAGTGVLSLVAARAGAKRVHAIEPNPAIWLLPELAEECGLADRITVHPRPSFEVELAERADVLVSDLRGALPLYPGHAAALRDARERLLSPGGVLVPARDELFVALVEAPGMWRHLASCWEGFERRGLAASALRRSVLNLPHGDRPAPILASDVLSAPAIWATLEYGAYDGATLEREERLTVTRGGTAHGLALWFRATLDDGVAYATAPGSALVYPRLFLPLLEPVLVEAGEPVTVTLRADASGERWAWDTSLTRATFRQASFFGEAASPDAFRRASSEHRPLRSARGDRARFVLDAMNGARTTSEIVAAAGEASGATGAARELARDEARSLLRRYAR